MGNSDGRFPLAEIDHVGIAVHAIDEALPYYIDRLGLPLCHRETLPAIRTELAYLDGGSAMLQLVAPIGPSAIAEHLEAHGEGLHHVCFTVDDLPASLAAVAGGDDSGVFMGGRSRWACFLDERPNGLLIELTETRPQGPASVLARERGSFFDEASTVTRSTTLDPPHRDRT